MWLASEYSDYASERKTLRVSNAKAEQRSTYFLQLPYRIALPLMLLSGLLHWLLSQSIFLAVVVNYDAIGHLVSPVAIASCGFSPLAMIFTASVAMAILLGTLAVGWCRKFPSSGIPLAGSCSLAISAACHRPAWDSEASLRAIMWGAVCDGDGEDGPTHCCFTSSDVSQVQNGKMYAGEKIEAGL